MKKHPTTTRQLHYSPRAVLAAIGLKLRAMDLLGPLEQVRIEQKRVKYSPVEKLTDALITILSGAKGMSEVNTSLRADEALQRAFGRAGCAEQSVIQETLDACTRTNVAELMQALNLIFERQSLAYQHDFRERMLLLDIDLTGCLAARSARMRPKDTRRKPASGGEDNWDECWLHSMRRS